MPPEGAVFPVMHAENSIVVLRFRKTFVVAWHGLLLDDILTDVAVVFGGGDHDDIVAWGGSLRSCRRGGEMQCCDLDRRLLSRSRHFIQRQGRKIVLNVRLISVMRRALLFVSLAKVIITSDIAKCFLTKANVFMM